MLRRDLIGPRPLRPNLVKSEINKIPVGHNATGEVTHRYGDHLWSQGSRFGNPDSALADHHHRQAMMHKEIAAGDYGDKKKQHLAAADAHLKAYSAHWKTVTERNKPWGSSSPHRSEAKQATEEAFKAGEKAFNTPGVNKEAAEIHNQLRAFHTKKWRDTAHDPDHRELAENHEIARDAHLQGHKDAHQIGQKAIANSRKITNRSLSSGLSNALEATKRAKGALSTHIKHHEEAAEAHRAVAGSHFLNRDLSSHHLRSDSAKMHDHLSHIGKLSKYANDNSKDVQAHKDVISAVGNTESLKYHSMAHPQLGKLKERHTKHLERLGHA